MSSSVMISYAVEAVGVAAAPTVVSIIDNFYRIDYSTVSYYGYDGKVIMYVLPVLLYLSTRVYYKYVLNAVNNINRMKQLLVIVAIAVHAYILKLLFPSTIEYMQDIYTYNYSYVIDAIYEHSKPTLYNSYENLGRVSLVLVAWFIFLFALELILSLVAYLISLALRKNSSE